MAEDNATNTESLTNCTRCRNPARSGIRCIRCGKTSHKSCLKILKNVQFLDNDTVVCCSDVQDVSNVAPEKSTVYNSNPDNSENIDKIKISYLEEIIRQKDLIISNQDTAIKSLKEQIVLMKEARSVCSLPQQSTSKESLVNTGDKVTKKNKVKNVNTAVTAPNGSTSSSVISKSEVSCAVHSAKALSICDKFINIENDLTTHQPLVRRVEKNKSRSILVGNQENSVNYPFKAASRITSGRLFEYHATNFDVNTDTIALDGYLKGFAPNASVIKLNSKNPDKYSSFKVLVPEAESSKILVSNIWPQGVVLNRFFRPKGFRQSRVEQSAEPNRIIHQ